MDTLITLQSATESKSATTGQMVQSWADWMSVWAEVVSGAQGENEKSSQTTSSDQRDMRIRYVEGVTVKMRVYDPDLERYYEIKGITPEGRKAYLVLHCRSTNINSPA